MINGWVQVAIVIAAVWLALNVLAVYLLNRNDKKKGSKFSD